MSVKEGDHVDENSPHFRIGQMDGRAGRGPSYVLPAYIAGYEKGRAEYKKEYDQAEKMGWLLPEGWDGEAWLIVNK